MHPDATKVSRRPWLWISLFVTLALVFWQWSIEQDEDSSPVVSDVTVVKSVRDIAPRQNPGPAVTTVSNPSPSTNTPIAPVAVVAVTTSELLPRHLPTAKVNQPLFAAHEWLPPPPKAEPPPPPQAPPLPFTYVGSMQDMPDGNTIILMQQKKVLMPKLGGQVTAQWRLDRENEQSIYFTYLPLNRTVTLNKARAFAARGRAQPVDETEDNTPLEQ